MKTPLLFTTGIVGALLLAGCGSGGNASNAPESGTSASAASSSKGDFKITMIAKSNSNPVFQAARNGAERAATELSKKVGQTISIDWRTPANEDPQEQAQRVAQAVNDGADAILISCSDAAKVTQAINDAVDKGVPVMTFDSDAPQSKRFSFYGADDVSAGTQVMEELMKLTGGKGNVAIIGGNQNAPNLQNRIKGIKDTAAKFPNAKIVDVFYHPETPQDAANAVLSAMKARPEIDAWAMPGGWPLFTKTLLTDLDPAKVKIVAVDCLPAQLPYIEKDIAPVLLAQPCFNWGYKSVEILVEKLIHKKDVQVINKMELVKVEKKNLGEWAKQLKDWGFPDVEDKYLNWTNK